MRGVFVCVLILAAPLALATAAILADGPQRARGESVGTIALSAGRDTFRQFCAPCHGGNGEGDGPIAVMLTTPPTDLTTLNGRNSGVFPLAMLEAILQSEARPKTSAHGSESMPIWGSTFRAIDGSQALARARIANLLAYIESIQHSDPKRTF
jgi:mono/diheme cytochrome c family protein